MRKLVRLALPAVLFVLPLTLTAQDVELVLTPSGFKNAAQVHFIEDSGHVSIMELEGNYDRKLPDGEFNAEPRMVLAQEYFANHPDELDFLVVFTTFEFETGEALAFHAGVRNDVTGIGIPIFDNSVAFGSEGVLQSFVDMAALTRYELDPELPQFELVLEALVHELFHRWTACPRFVDEEGEISTDILASDLHHWSFLLDSGASLMYGNEWRDNGDGSFSSIAIRKYLSPLDLYLAGFLGSDEVPPLTLITSPGQDPDELPRLGAMVHGTPRTVTVDQIIAAEGPRLPSAQQAQRDFKVGFVLAMRPGQTIDAEQLAALETVREALLNRFPILTRGRAVLNVYSPEEPGVDVGAPSPLSGGEIRHTEADINDGIAWLRSQQSVEGYWRDTLETTARDTAISLDTLRALDPFFAGAGVAVGWLEQAPTANVDELARRIIALGSAGEDTTAYREALIDLGNPDGGWGLGRGYASDALDTAWALIALHGSPELSAQMAASAGDFLVTSQGTDGGWGHTPEGASRIPVTTTVLEALQLVSRLAEVHDDAVAWLASKQNLDGGFGDSPSTAHDTANALLGLMNIGAIGEVNGAAALDYLNSTQSVPGSWEGSTYTTALTVTALKRFAYPNWSLLDLSADPHTPHDGDEVLVTALLANTGNSFAPAGVIRLYLGDPGSGGTMVDELSIPTLAPGANATANFIWESRDHAGAQTLVTIVDPDQLVEEADEGDNTMSLQVTVEPPPDGVDLVLSQSALTVDPSQPVILPTELVISTTASNLGTEDAGSTRVRLWNGEVGNGAPAGDVIVNLPARSSTPISLPFTLSEPGTTTLSLQIDPDSEIPEADENNNTVSTSVSTVPNLDLEVHDEDLHLSGSPYLGHDLEFTVHVRNSGTQEIPAAEVRYLIVWDGGQQELRTDTETFGPGEELERCILWRVDREGDLRFVVQLDPQGLVTERDETNNGAGLDFVATQLHAVNLSLSHSDLSFTPDPALEGAGVEIGAVVRNTGNQLVSGAELAFYVGDPASGGVPIGPVVAVPDLEPASSILVTQLSEALSGSHDRLIYAVVDPANVVPESNEDDNSAFNVLEVLSLPDLAQSSSGVVVSPRFPEAGGTVLVTAELSNLGQQDAFDIQLRLTGDGTPLASDQTLPTLAAGATTTVEFQWSFPEAGGSVTMLLAVDPDNLVAEGHEDNNSYSTTVTARDSSDPLSNRYISPNGDGIQDDTVFFFTLDQHGTATGRVLSPRGEIVFTAEAIEATPDGAFSWNGRGADGRVVVDGEYSLQILADGDLVSTALVTVDTNRSPIFDAFGTRHERLRNQTCGEHDLEGATMPLAEDRLYFYRQRTYPEGIFRCETLRSNPELLINARRPGGLQVSDDDAWLAYDDDDGWSSAAISYSDSDGSSESFVTTIAFGDNFYEILPASQELLFYSPFTDELRQLTMGTSVPAETVLTSSRGRMWLSPDGEIVVIRTTEGFEITSLSSGSASQFATHPDDFDDWWQVSWAPDSSRFATIENYWDDAAPGDVAGRVKVYDRSGVLVRTFEFPFSPMGSHPEYAQADPIDPSTIAFMSADTVWEPSWSSSSEEFVFNVAYEEWTAEGDPFASFGLLYRADMASGQLEIVGFNEPWFRGSSGPDFIPGYTISTWDGSSWVPRGGLSFGLHYAEKELALGDFLPDAAGEYKLRISQDGHEAAHIDRVALRLGRAERSIDLQPSSVHDLGGVQDVTAVLKGADHEVLDAHERSFELRWDEIDQGLLQSGHLRLAIAAREESLSERDARPFTYPPQSDEFYTYVLNDENSLVVDGLLDAADELEEPLFEVFTRPDTGHPSGTVAGWVQNDDKFLYAALDFSVDNTLDGDNDWASLWVDDGSGWREFRVSTSDTRWGEVGFTHTRRAHHTHKYYEFKIPLSELGAKPGATIHTRLSAYGTAAILDQPSQWIPDYPSFVTWIPGEDTVLISQYFDVGWVVHLDEDNHAEMVFAEHDGFDQPHFSPSGGKLLFKSTLQILDPMSECYNPQADWFSSDWWLYESLANLTTELRIVPAEDGRGALLEGTATDLNFARYTLEYAAASNPGFWSAIAPPSEIEVFDDQFTVWVPPEAGSHLIRLSVEDLAGNVRRVVRRIGGDWSESSISDLWLEPHYISPNGDGVQDETTLHYRVLQPVHLEINIVNEHGETVRSLQRDHSTIGEEIDLVWNGHDDNGLPVLDGEYRLELQSYRFWITVDTTPPTTSLEVNDAYASTPNQTPALVAVAPSLTYRFDDTNPARGMILTGVGATPLEWSELQSVMSSGGTQSRPLSLDDFVNHSFRLEARDLAGNRSVVTTSLGAQELIIDRIAAPDWTGVFYAATSVHDLYHGMLQIQAAETFIRPLSELAIQLRPAGQTEWLDLPQSTLVHDGHDLELVYDMADVELAQSTDLRLRAVDDRGFEGFSNVIRFATGGLDFKGVVDFQYVEPQYQGALHHALAAAELDSTRDTVMWAVAANIGTLSDTTLILSSNDNPSFAASQAVPLAAAAESDAATIYVFFHPDVRPCTAYEGFVRALTAPEWGDRIISSTQRSFSLPCLDLDVMVAPVFAEGCGEEPPEEVMVELDPVSFNNVELRTLSVAVGEPDNVVANINLPESGRKYFHEIETRGFAEGSHPIFFALSNGEGERVEFSSALVVDRSAPVIDLSYPAEGQRLCALPGDDSTYVNIEGRVEDVGAGVEFSFDPQAQVFGSGCVSYASWAYNPDGCPANLLPAPAAPFIALENYSALGNIGELVDPNGEITLHLTARDWGGHVVCAEQSFVVDGEMEGVSAAASVNLFSPNGDGVLDDVTLAVSADEPFQLDATIFAGVYTADGWQPSGAPLRILADDLATLGAHSLIWDGRDDLGTLLPDAVYVVVFDLVDACGNRRQAEVAVESDTGLPTALIITPQPGVLSTTMVEVTGIADDANFLDYELHYASAANPSTWITLAIDDSPVSGGLLGLWNTNGLVGQYNLRLWVRDTVGNQSVVSVVVELSPNDGLISLLEAVPYLISPNGDGARDTSAIRFELSQQTTVSLQILDELDTPILALLADQILPSGAQVREWNGVNAAAVVVPDGLYRAALQAVTDGGSFQQETVPIVVDATAPQIVVTRPAGAWVSGSGDLMGSVLDERIAEYTASVRSVATAAAWTTIGHGTSEVVDGVLGSLEGLVEGEYLLRIEARDGAENRSETQLGFNVDSTAPEVQLRTPHDLVSLTGTVKLDGSVEDEHLASWRVDVGAGWNPATWIPVAAGTADTAGPDWSGTWDTTSLSDGHYALRLLGEDLAGNVDADYALVNLDHTAPIVGLNAPSTGDAISTPMAITGTALDDDLLIYRIALATAGSELWSELGVGSTPVSNDLLLAWNALPPDGEYRLRLTAEDGAGNSAQTEVVVTVDTVPPQPPTGLEAELVESNVELSWNPPASKADLLRYLVSRNGYQITATPITGTTYTDLAVAEGSYSYTVRAVDAAGNHSEPCDPAEIVVDLTPPTTSILNPRDQAYESGAVDVRVQVSAEDLAEYRILADGAVIYRSTIPAQAEVVTQWDTTLHADGPVALRLEAEDVNDNVGAVEISVSVDNTPPSAPTGLTANANAADVDLVWDANTDPDLLGYLVLRNGSLLNVPPDAGSDLRPYAIGDTFSSDLGVPDGTHSYTVVAVDLAGNISPPSTPASVDIDQRVPQARIVSPESGARVDGMTFVLAATDDLDVDRVEFQFQAQGDASWLPVSVDTNSPWETHWDPDSLSYGSYLLRAVATDEGGQTDPDPVAIEIIYTDLERPDPVQGLRALVDGGDVHLSWDANNEPDLAGYHVERRDDQGAELRLTNNPITATGYTDPELADGSYLYRIVAVDQYDNEADASDERAALVYAPSVERPFSPTQAINVSFSGLVQALATVEGEIVDESAITTALTPVVSDDNGLFAFLDIPLSRGRNDVSFSAVDSAGNRSKTAHFAILSKPAPSSPTGLAATVDSFDVDLSWNADPESDLLGYRVFRDGMLITPSVTLPPTAVIASEASSSHSTSTAPANAVDGSSFTYWAPHCDESSPAAGQWWQMSLDSERQITAINLQWRSEQYRALDFDILAWHLDDWLTIAEVRDNASGSTRIELPQFVTTDRLRLVLRRINLPDTTSAPVRLSELWVDELSLVTSPNLVDTAPHDGFFSYQVTALDAAFESSPSDPLEVGVGDVLPPDPVSLSSAVNGSDVSLSWTSSPAADLWGYHLYRDGQRIVETVLTTFIDPELPNGEYHYVVHTVDQQGNVSDPSNTEIVTVEVPLLAAPADLTVTVPGASGRLDLSWQAGAGPTPAAYRISRSLTSGGPYSDIADVGSLSFADERLDDGTTYFYVVSALDAIGNQSAHSNEASGTPEDNQAPPMPTIGFPATPSHPHRTEAPVVPLMAGRAEAGSTVRVFREGSQVAEVVSLLDAQVTAAPFTTWSFPRLSPSGRYLWLEDNWDSQIYDFDNGSTQSVAVGGPVRWMPAADEVLYVEYDSNLRTDVIHTYSIADNAIRQLTTTSSAELAVPSPDSSQLAVVGGHDDGSGLVRGLWTVDLEDEGWTLLVNGLRSYQMDEESLQYSPDGRFLAFYRTSPERRIEIVELATLQTSLIPDSGETDTLSWSPDSHKIYYNAPDANWYWHIMSYELVSAGVTTHTSGDRDHFMVRCLQDGRSLVYVADFELLELQDLPSGTITPLHQVPDWDWLLDVAASGQLLTQNDDVPIRLDPAGWWQTHSLALDPGDNPFRAQAADESGNQSVLSEQVIVTLLSSGLGDLAITTDDLQMVPSVPVIGEESRLSMTVHNRGGAPTSPAGVSLVLVRPDNTFSDLSSGLTLDAIAAGGSQSLSTTLIFTGQSGRYRVVAAADPLDELDELSEANNRAEMEFTVLDEARPELSVSTDRSSYTNHEDVAITMTLLNGGSAIDGRLELRVEDAAGYPVELLDIIPIDDFGYGQSERWNLRWNTADFFAGDYRIKARLLGEHGTVLEAESCDFNIESMFGVSSSVLTDWPAYTVGSMVEIQAGISYDTGNIPLRGVVATLTLSDSDSHAVRQWQQALGDLLPETQHGLSFSWASDGAGPGPYTLSLQCAIGEEELSSSGTTFELLLGPPVVHGSLNLNPATPPVGTDLAAAYSINNSGATDLADLPISVLLVDPRRGLVLATHNEQIQLPAGQSHSGGSSFATADLGLDNYTVVLQTMIEDGTRGVVTVTLANASFSTADGTPPQVTVLRPENGGYMGSDRLAVVRAIDGLSSLDRVELSVDDAAWLPLVPHDPSLGHWARRLSELAEGEHQITSRAVDDWGNSASSPSLSFTADFTPPLILISGVVNGGSYGEPVTPLIEVVEDHPELEVFTLNGSSFVSGTQVSEEGSYLLIALAEDAAGNRNEARVNFTVGAPPIPQLSCSKHDLLALDADHNGAVSPGDELRYDIVVSVSGEGILTNLELEDIIPESSSLVPGSLQVSHGTILGTDPIQVLVDTVPAGTDISGTFRVVLDGSFPEGSSFISNQATLYCDQLEALLSDDPESPGSSEATVTEVVSDSQGEPELVVSKTAELLVDLLGDLVPSPGDTVEYVVTISNQGTAAATAVELHDAIPEYCALAPDSLEIDEGTLLNDNPIQVWLGELPAGAERELRFAVVIGRLLPATVDQISNQATLSSAELPPILSDDPTTSAVDDPTVMAVNHAQAQSIPMLDGAGMTMMILLLLLGGTLLLRRSKPSGAAGPDASLR